MVSYSEKIKTYLNDTYGNGSKENPAYNSYYFLRRIKTDLSYVYAICEQSMSDADFAFDWGRFSFLTLPTLTEAEVKKIIPGVDLTKLAGNNVLGA